MHNRKRTHYTESTIYPELRFEDFKQELFPKIRNLIKSNHANHPWLALSDEQLLHRASLWKRDFQTGREGYTFASALLLGKDEVIQNIMPHYKIDAIVRIQDTTRYDDREYIQTNLVDAYEKLMDFVAKHLPDKFFTEGDQRVSLRTKIFREIVANLIIHREYTNAQPCTFVIHSDRVETENANNPHGEGPINPDSFSPFPKNPTIAKFFMQLGRVDELGSGVLNVNRFIRNYTGIGDVAPEFIEGNSFRVIIPLSEKIKQVKIEQATQVKDDIGRVNDIVCDRVSDRVKERIIKTILLLDNNPGLRANQISKTLQVSVETVARDLRKAKGLIEYKGAPKTGGYFLTEQLTKNIRG